MPPIRQYNCKDCEASFEHFELGSDDSHPQCNECNSLNVSRAISAPGGYSITGNNSASVRPRYAGSKKPKGHR